MKYLGMAVMGLIVGALAKLFYIGDNGNSMIMSMVLGIAGSYAAGMVGGMISKPTDGKVHPAGFVFSILGAMALIWIGKQFGIQL